MSTVLVFGATRNQIIGISFISLIALFILVMLGFLVYSIILQRRYDTQVLPEVDGFGSTVHQEDVEGVEAEGESAFHLNDDAPLPGADGGEGESFLREMQAAQAKQQKKSGRMSPKLSLRQKKK